MPLPGIPILPSRGLIDGRVRLRVLESADAHLLQELSRDPEVVRWTSYPANLDEEAALGRIARGNAVPERAVFCVAELDGRPAGTCGAGIGDTDDEIEIFYAVLPWARRQGVASTAVALLVSAARAAGATTVNLATHIDNTASQVVARRAGFLELGQERRTVKGIVTDVQVWQWQPGND